MRGYLNSVVKVERCAQNLDDIGIAVNDATDRFRNVHAVLESFRKAGLKLTKKTILEFKKLNSFAKPFNENEFYHELAKFKTSSRN